MEEPGEPAGAGPVRLLDLLRLRSGIPGYVRALAGSPPNLSAFQRYHTPGDLVRLALDQPDRQPPGVAWRYPNTD